MRSTKLLSLIAPVLLLAAPAHAAAQEGERSEVEGPRLRITARDLLDRSPPVPRLGLAPLPASLAVPVPAWSERADPRRWGLPRPPGWLARSRPFPGLAPPPAPAPSPVDTAARFGLFPELELPAVVQQIADLGLVVEGRGELGGVWNRYRPCTAGLRLSCDPGLFPQIQPEVQFGVQVGGTITDRVHVDVDYDQRREFDAANNINVYYQGGQGELLQRLEMGDVSLDLPASRYLARGIPAGNFGFKAAARLGGVDVEAVWAQQKGDVDTREFRLGGAGQSGLVQDQELVLDDADYATGQFFFLVDPRALDGWPHVDVLTLDRIDADAAARPRADRLVVYRDEGVSVSQFANQARTGRFLADAVTADGSRRHSGLFTLLEPGEDYYIHSSGLWIALRAPLRDDEALAVAYETETGALVGDPDAESSIEDTPELRLVRGPVTIHQPGQPTWEWEMHQVYRLDSSAQVEASTLELVISLGHEAGGATFEEFAGRRIPLLRLFGLDDDAPVDRIDVAHVFRPGAELDALGPTPLRGTFIVFPTLEPFGRPPPVPSEGITAPEAEAILGSRLNPAIYNEIDPVIREGSSLYRLNFDYQVELEGLLSSFNLGAFGIRQGSERITVDDRLLVRGVDYVIDYDLGLVTLLDPQATIGTNPDAAIRATWEQRSLFQVAPTTVVGLNARAPVREYGQLNFVGLYQAEQSIVRRPQLGLAPASVLLGGVTGELAFQADWVSRALDAIPLLAVDSVTRLDVAGELALSAPDPNRAGATYLDDFEATDEIPLSLDAFEWQLGSAPQDATGVSLPVGPFEVANATELVWQDRYLQAGQEVGSLTPQEIDGEIRFAGARLAERVLYLTMGGNGATVPEWRSITTVLSTTGRDLSRSEFLEFYAAPWQGEAALGDVQLVIDIGTVHEDAFYFDDQGELSGTGSFGRPWGLGVLDEEARLAQREVWGPVDDQQGLWDQDCEADRLNPVPLGDPRANCTVNNGRPDTEDLNANGVLDGDGPVHRYVVPLGPSSPYLVRGQNATSTAFRLFRIPLRGPGAIPLNGASDASWRFVRHLRVTVVKPSPGEGTLALARVRIAGSRWTKRNIDGVLGGLTGDVPGTGAATAEVRVGPVSQLTDGDAYVSPPGVETQLQDPSSALGASGVEFNEKSLRLSWDALPGDERAEVYFRYPQQPRSFLEYRQIRFWAVAPADIGSGDEHRLLFKLGTDPRNYYVYQTPIRSAGGSVQADDWLPERVVDFQEWFALKAEAELLLAENGNTGPVQVWSADSTYGIVLEDRARAPNLSAVRELTLAVYNGGTVASAGEVWIDDIRLGSGARDVGLAGRLDVELDAGGVVQAAVSYSGEGGRFRQLGDAPTYETVNELSVHTTTQLGRFAPAEWGVAMPVTVSYQRTSLDPQFLQGTDIRAERLPELRETGSSRRRVGVALRKTTPSSNPLVSALVDGTAVRVGYIGLEDNTVTTASRLDGIDGGVEVDRGVANVDVPVVPGFVTSLLRWLLPRRVEESAAFRRLADTRLRLTPERIGLSTSYVRQEARVWRYGRVLVSGADADVDPIESPRRTLESGARVALRPLESLTARVGVVTGRDLLEPERATEIPAQRQALRRARTDVAGVAVGWERSRVMTAEAAYRPAVADWLRPSVGWTSRYGLRRDPSHVALVGSGDGQSARLLNTFNTDRRLSRGLVFDLPAAARAALLPPRAVPNGGADRDAAAGGPASGARPGPLTRAVVAALSPLKPVDLSWTDELGSRFDRDLADPGLDYQLGIGTLAELRFLEGDTAAMALRRDAFRARSGVRVGSSTSVDVGYSESDVRVYDLRVGDRSQLERSWPSVQVSWTDVPLPGFLDPVLRQWSVSTGYVRSRRATTLLGQVRRVRSLEETTIPVELRFSFPGSLALAYLGTRTTGDGRDPTGTTAQTARSHSVDLSGRVELPGRLGDRLTEPIRLSITYDYELERQVRRTGPRPESSPPTPFVDYMNRRVYVSASTLIARMDIGLQISYVDRRTFIGTQVGSSQFRLGVFGQFNMRAGRELGR